MLLKEMVLKNLEDGLILIRIKSFAENELKGTKKSSKKYNYHGLNTNIIFNYVIHKTGDDFRNLMNSIFQDKAKIGNDAWFVYTSAQGANK